MTVEEGARDGQGEPNPGHLEQFCHVIVPGFLTDVCHVDQDLAAQVGEDILAHAESYAALDNTARDVLVAPFAEEVAGYEPPEAPLELKGAVAVVVRSSLLEEAHANGPVDAGGIKSITGAAAAPLSHFLAARRRPVAVRDNLFAGLAAASPRAWACLGTVVYAVDAGGGRWPYSAPAAPLPELPVAEVEAPRAENRENVVVLSGIDTRFDRLLVQHMRKVTEDGDAVFFVASLSRISRHLGKLLRALEYLLAHGVPILTANYLLRPHDVWVRRPPIVPVDQKDPLGAWRVSRGLSGAHRVTVAKVVQQLGREGPTSGQ